MTFVLVGAALKIGAILGELIVATAFLYVFYLAFIRR